MDKNEVMKSVIEKARMNMNSGLGGPFGAAIVKDGKVLVVTSNTVLDSHDPTCHAEVNAIREAGKILGTHDLKGCELYATGYPCPMCLGAIVWANIDKVYYGSNLDDADSIGFRDKVFYDMIKNDSISDVLDLEELGHDECASLLKEYHDSGMVMY